MSDLRTLHERLGRIRRWETIPITCGSVLEEMRAIGEALGRFGEIERDRKQSWTGDDKDYPRKLEFQSIDRALTRYHELGDLIQGAVAKCRDSRFVCNDKAVFLTMDAMERHFGSFCGRVPAGTRIRF